MKTKSIIFILLLFTPISCFSYENNKCGPAPEIIHDIDQILKGIDDEGYGARCHYNNYFFVAFDSAFTATILDCVNDEKCQLREDARIEDVRLKTFNQLKKYIGRPEMKRGSPSQVIGGSNI